MTQKGQSSAAQTREEIPKPVLVSRGFFRGGKWKFGDCIGTFAEILPVFVNQLIKEAEARGAEEQRRKDAEGQEKPIAWAHRNHIEDAAYSPRNKPFVVSTEDIYGPETGVALYTRPANAAMLKAALKAIGDEVLEGSEPFRHAVVRILKTVGIDPLNGAEPEDLEVDLIADAMRYRIVRQRFLEDARNQGEDLTAEQFDAKVDGDTEARATLIRAEESTQTAAMEDRANAEIEKWSL